MWIASAGSPGCFHCLRVHLMRSTGITYIRLDVCNTERLRWSEKRRQSCLMLRTTMLRGQSSEDSSPVSQRDIFILTLLSAGEYVYPAFNCRVVGNPTRHRYKYYNCNDGRRDWKTTSIHESQAQQTRSEFRERKISGSSIDQNPGAWCDCRAPECDRVSY